MTKKQRVTIKQIGGDDGYCWCVLVDGRVKWDGMQRREAQWRQDQERKILEANRVHEQEVCDRCGILIRVDGGHRCESCGKDV